MGMNAPGVPQVREEFGARVRARRQGLGVSREYVAGGAHSSFGGMRHIEQGAVWPQLDTALRVAIVLETTLDELVTPEMYAAIAETLPEPFRSRYFERVNNVVAIEAAAKRRAAKPAAADRKKAVGEQASSKASGRGRVARRRPRGDDTGVLRIAAGHGG